MSKLLPDISSIAIPFHTGVVETASPFQATWQVCPVVNTSPGAGSVGVTSARATIGAASARRAAKVYAANILIKVGPLVVK